VKLTFDERVVVYRMEVSSSENQYQINPMDLTKDDEDRLAFPEDRAGESWSCLENPTSTRCVQKLKTMVT
jgi:hypothetical protein